MNGRSRQIMPGGPVGFLRRRWLLLAVPLVIMPVVSYLNALRKPEQYRSSAHLLVKESNLSSPLLDNYALNIDLQAQLETLGKIGRQDVLLQEVQRRLDAADSTGAVPRPTARKEALDIAIADDGGIVLAATASSPQQAQQLVAAYQDACIAELNRPRLEAAEKLTVFLESELVKTQDGLLQAQQSLAEYRSDHGKVLPELEAITYNLLLSLEAEQVQLESQASALAEKRSQLEAQPDVRANTIDGLRTQIVQIEGDLAVQSLKMTESHPDLQIMRARLARLKEDLSMRERGLTPPGSQREQTPAEQEYAMLLIDQNALDERLVQVRKRVGELQKQIATASNHDAEYVRRERNVESRTELYLDLVRRRERAATTRHLVETNHGDLVRIVQPASLPSDPDSPQPTMDLLMGLVTGMLLGVGLAFGAEMTDGRIYGTRNLEAALDAPTLLVLDETA